MEYVDKLITAIIGCIFCIFTYICKRKLDERKSKQKNISYGITIIDSLLEEINAGLEIIQNKKNEYFPKENWDKIKNIQCDVAQREAMSIISEISKPNNVLDICKNYFENISKDYKKAIENRFLNANAQNDIEIKQYQEETKKVIKILEQTRALLDENSTK